jgi:hypothetical protein
MCSLGDKIYKMSGDGLKGGGPSAIDLEIKPSVIYTSCTQIDRRVVYIRNWKGQFWVKWSTDFALYAPSPFAFNWLTN